MLERTGTTTVADIETVPELLPEVWTATSLRVCSFIEMTCVRSQRNCRKMIDDAARLISGLRPPRGYAGLSPHAIYSTVPALLRLAAERGRRENWRITTHVSESPQEFEMCRRASGPMFDWLKRQRDMSDCGSSTPVQILAQCGLLGPNFLAIHANYLEPKDIRLLADSGSSVAHCPRSHSFFGHDPFPYSALAKAGVNVCLGTDSLASVNRIYGNKPELSLFAEMSVFAAKTGTAPETIVRMATLNGARALGLEGQIGQLSPGARADLIAIPYSGAKADLFEAIVNNWRDVSASMIDGRWVVLPENALGE
jgi:cytosine/adenosine deaminase-related metal-dependent hydrolase